MTVIKNWFIFASVLIVASAQPPSSTSGSCASIGYSTSCCPRSEEDRCQATDGECYCNSDCHIHGDCCEDVHCPAQPKTCADVGINQCCDDPSGNGYCEVYSLTGNSRCSCNVSCHERNDCCSDAQSFCIPDSCTGARKHPDCCNRVDASACYVPGGNCYCDPLCTLYHDCCDDAETHLSQCARGSNRFSRMKLQSFQSYKDSNRRRFYNRDQTSTYQRRDNAIYQEAPADRVQRMFMNEREFRSRRRMAGRSPA